MLTGHKNTKKQGDVGLGVAIAYFVEAGATVSIPLTDSQDYDLVIDDGSLKRVQVKTTTFKAPSGHFIASLTVKGGNRSGINKVKLFDSTKVDLVFVLTETNDRYLLPSNILGTKVTLGKAYDKYKV